jgi:hypothetical protein
MNTKTDYDISFKYWVLKKWTDILLLMTSIDLLAILVAPWARSEQTSSHLYTTSVLTLLIWRCAFSMSSKSKTSKPEPPQISRVKEG